MQPINITTNKIESGVELLSRLTQRPSLENINPKLIANGPYSKEFIEITGASGTGKTTVLIDFVVRTLLPSNLSGRSCGAIFIDTEHKFDMFRLIAMIEYELKRMKVRRSDIEPVIKDCLRNLIVLNCYDSEQLQVTFYNLEKILMDNPNVALVVVDCIPVYYWQYRNVSTSNVTVHGYTKRMLQSLEDCVRNSNVVVAYARQGEADMKEIKLEEVTYRILLKKELGAFYAHVKEKQVPYALGKIISWL